MCKLCVLVLIFLLSGCVTRQGLAPVVELKWHPHNARQTTHIVKRGETLYAISFHYDLDYRQLAAINHLQSPYALRVGQVLRVRANLKPNHAKFFRTKTKIASKHLPQTKKASYSLPRQRTKFVLNTKNPWRWPVNGRIVASFLPQQGKKGIDIAGVKGDKIHAASNGVVAYAGSGLSGYGNLIIIKHNDQFLTAYGNNSHNIVKEGQKVKAGQIIAEMGVIDRRYWGVHFEIRKNGQPINPLIYLRGN